MPLQLNLTIEHWVHTFRVFLVSALGKNETQFFKVRGIWEDKFVQLVWSSKVKQTKNYVIAIVFSEAGDLGALPPPMRATRLMFAGERSNGKSSAAAETMFVRKYCTNSESITNTVGNLVWREEHVKWKFQSVSINCYPPPSSVCQTIYSFLSCRTQANIATVRLSLNVLYWRLCVSWNGLHGAGIP